MPQRPLSPLRRCATLAAAVLVVLALARPDARPAAAGDSAVAGAGADAISLGVDHTCALKSGGVWCWGSNGGTLGNGTTPNSSVPVAVSGLESGVSAISAGLYHTCALKDGGAWCWGLNAHGQLGTGTAMSSSVPVPVSGLGSGVSAISAGWNHTCALKDGGVWCWGFNQYGQLGSAPLYSPTPLLLTGFESAVTSITAGGNHTCALKNGGVSCLGDSTFGQLGDGTVTGSGVAMISAGLYHTCALKNGGAACWGFNLYGGLGDGTTTNSSAPVTVSGLASGVSVVSAGGGTCALKDGGAWCWGRNAEGQLGDGTTTERHLPVAVSSLGSGISAISAGVYHTCALRDGVVECWGRNDAGQLGDGTTTNSSVPVAVVGLPTTGVTAISAGGGHTCALKSGGVWCWGWNLFHQLGNGIYPETHVLVAVPGLTSEVTAVTSGGDHSCALRDGAVWCWGRSTWGQTGNFDSATDSTPPLPVSTLSSGVTAVSAGANYTCALKDGGVWCWGLNISGQLGNPSAATLSLAPLPVIGLASGVTAISTGTLHACAVKDGGAWCWGYNGSGQLGNNTTVDSPVPVPVSGLSQNVAAISADQDHSCAVTSGAVLCWGGNSVGQLGDDTAMDSPVPVALPALASGVSAISAGIGFTCVLKDGAVWCWGWNPFGQLGNGDLAYSRFTPQTVSGFTSGVGEISANFDHACAIKDGVARCWGHNNYGQLGDNTTLDSSVPVTMAADSDGDVIADGVDNCPAIPNHDQRATRRDLIDLHVYGKFFDDTTVLNSTTLGDACNPDIDGDGLANDIEAELGPTGSAHAQCASATGPTDPLKLDTDADGFTDRAECMLDTNPVDPATKPPNPNAGVDTDHDGLPDALEVTLGTNPAMADSDGDRLLDGVEFLRYGSDPLNANTDGDICSDGKEAASLNDDTNVNSTDLLIAAQAQGPKSGPKYVLDFDVNRDDKINSTDLLLVAKLHGAC